MLGPQAGTIGCVGVAPNLQGRGIGTAMVARASDHHPAGYPTRLDQPKATLVQTLATHALCRVNGLTVPACRCRRGSGGPGGHANTSGGRAGDGLACASMIGLDPATNWSSAAPSTSRAGNGSPAARLISPAVGSS